MSDPSQPLAAPRSPACRAAARPPGLPGGMIVATIVLLAIGLGLFAVWFQRDQTRRCLAFFGPEAARRVQSAPRVELWRLEAEGDRLRAVSRIDISRAPGLVHLRRGLIEDFNYAWDEDRNDGGLAAAGPADGGESRRDPVSATAWDQALAFFAERAGPDGEPGPQSPAGKPGRSSPADDPAAVTIIAFDLDNGGLATVVGRPGRVGLGRLREGLVAWLDEVRGRESLPDGG